MKKNTFFLFLFVSILTNAQTFTLTGKVVDENNNSLSKATVLVEERKNGTSTNFDGKFTINLTKGNHTIQVSFIGYKTVSKEVSLTKNNEIEFVLFPNSTLLEEVLVAAVRVKANAPVTHTNISKKELAKRNLGQDIPTLLNYLPSVVTTTDAGAGVGYSSLRVRGSDATRVNVTINGIPYNDAESQSTFWVNLGDFTSSVENIQLQRGVGTSTNGAGAFGASLNILTDGVSQKQSAQIASSIGSFETLKNTIKFNTGLLNDQIAFSGRFSKINSNGYLDRATSDLKSYFLQANYIDENTLIKSLIFGGKEVTYQAWNGVDAITAKNNRTFNGAGVLYNSDWTIRGFYDNQVDNYTQNHAQLHWNQKYNNRFSSNLAVHYTRGNGYFEEYTQAYFEKEPNLWVPTNVSNQTAGNSDSIVRRYANSHFYGTTYSFNYKNEVLDFIFGGAYNKHEGRHFGETIWNRFAGNTEIRAIYYDRPGDKTAANFFAKATYKILDNLNVYIDVQQRKVTYKAEVEKSPSINEVFHFFNPKAGISFTMNKTNNFYFSYAKAHKEPGRADYKEISDAIDFPRPEELNDFELGWRFTTENIKINSNIYYMKYIDQLVLTGEIDNNGAFNKTNSGKSYRLGLEIDANIKVNNYLNSRPNITLSSNKNIAFKQGIDTTVTNLGSTDISFSPKITAANTITVKPFHNFEVSLLSKFVGEQYLTNTEETDKKLESYFVNEFNLGYVLNPKSIFKTITFNALVNNIFNKEYISNGYFHPDWGTYFYPQATRNFLVGVTLKF